MMVHRLYSVVWWFLFYLFAHQQEDMTMRLSIFQYANEMRILVSFFILITI